MFTPFHIAYHVTSLEESRKFYKDFLGWAAAKTECNT